MDYDRITNSLSEVIAKKTLAEIKNIEIFDHPQLAEYGNNDVEGYQIFTPDHIVQMMMKCIGIKNIVDFTKTILEPTSGDGAFTVRIFEKRLEKAQKGNCFEIDCLKAISTMYSIEMDRDLVRKQRSNILTTLIKYAEKNKIELSEDYLNLFKIFLTTNFIWAQFNSQNEITALFCDVAYTMPEAEKGKYRPIRLPVWIITDEDITLTYEDVEV